MSENEQPWIGTHEQALDAVLSYHGTMRGLTLAKIDELSEKVRALGGGSVDKARDAPRP